MEFTSPDEHELVDKSAEIEAAREAQKEHELFAASLRVLADWYEKHPEINLPILEVNVYSMDTKDEAGALAKALGSFAKRYTDDLLIVKKQFGLIALQFYFTRESVCTAKVVGKKMEPEQYIPGRLIPAREVDIIEWDCHALNVNEDKSHG
jgi:hypothetical protein